MFEIPKRVVELPRGFPGGWGESDLTLGNEPLRFRNVSEDVLASKKPPGGLEDACLRTPKRGVELSGGFAGRWENQIVLVSEDDLASEKPPRRRLPPESLPPRVPLLLAGR